MAPYRKTTDLPDALPVFPLGGAMLFPHWDLPLNIFEPRYLNMIDDAMRGERLIGMVQPVGGPPDRPDIAGVGCAGRLTSYSETDDGRYLITLSGVCRFGVRRELDVTTPYRQVEPDWSVYGGDLFAPSEAGLPERSHLVRALRAYIEAQGLQADWGAVENAPMETLIHALAAGCPFDIAEKQALLEAPALADRARTLIALLEIDGRGGDRGPVQ
ncbi:MAG: peptidase S16 [Alphaproteobacteria bacterium RIFCSPHIGHO2_12_FULL_63_12]|nr:MAG: peptidase S16 [Alphaproteobacteria bacterium RIFCSPHIGHO2_12_FULL_63_12]